METLFPDGVSEHGDRYFLNGQAQTNIVSPYIELLFEYVRRSYFPDKPSRFQSFFARDSLEQARVFRNKYRGDGAIWKVECDNSVQADMNLLALGQTSILVGSYFAHRYWSGLARIDRPPFWE